MAQYPVLVTDHLLQEITRRIVENFSPEKVILFGSRASGTSRADSDIDLLVIMNSRLPSIQRAVDVKRACRPRFVSMDVLVKTPEEMATRLQYGNLFLRQILEQGKVLYERQPEVLDWVRKAEGDLAAAHGSSTLSHGAQASAAFVSQASAG